MSSVPYLSKTPESVDLTKEYVAGGLRFGGDRILTGTGDECFTLTATTIDQMQLDPQVSSSIEFLVEAVVSDGVEVLPGASDKDPMFGQAEEIAKAWERALKRVSLRAFLSSMLRDSIADGARIGQVTWQLVDDPADEDYQKLTLERLAEMPREGARFVVDDVWRVIAIYLGPGRFYAPEKFVWLSLHVRDEDPRGRSLIRAAHTAWFLKNRIPTQYHRFLDQLILPFFIGYTAPGADKRNELQLQTDGTKKPVAASQAMLDALTQLSSKFAAVFPNEAKVDVWENKGTGEAFPTAYDTLDRQIVKGILLQDLATREGQHQARAASETHMGVLDYRVMSLKCDSAAMLDELARRFTRYNYGAQAASTIAPVHTLGDSERRDWATDLLALAAAWRSGILKLADIPKLFAIVGIELAEDWQERMAAGVSTPPEPQKGSTTDPENSDNPDDAAVDDTTDRPGSINHGRGPESRHLVSRTFVRRRAA